VPDASSRLPADMFRVQRVHTNAHVRAVHADRNSNHLQPGVGGLSNLDIDTIANHHALSPPRRHTRVMPRDFAN